MILSFKTYFPNGKGTRFKEKILDGSKIHTIRDGKRIWSPGDDIHFTIKSRTPEQETIKRARVTRVDLIHIFIIPRGYGFIKAKKIRDREDIELDVSGVIRIRLDGNYLTSEQVYKLIANDGLTPFEFLVFFYPRLNNEGLYTGRLIHWTERYDYAPVPSLIH